jgi:hypothetical protein
MTYGTIDTVMTKGEHFFRDNHGLAGVIYWDFMCYLSTKKPRYSIWQFLLDLLCDDSTYGRIVRFVTDETKPGEIEVLDKAKLAYLWGRVRNRPKMNFKNVTRMIRYFSFERQGRILNVTTNGNGREYRLKYLNMRVVNKYLDSR